MGRVHDFWGKGFGGFETGFTIFNRGISNTAIENRETRWLRCNDYPIYVLK